MAYMKIKRPFFISKGEFLINVGDLRMQFLPKGWVVQVPHIR